MACASADGAWSDPAAWPACSLRDSEYVAAFGAAFFLLLKIEPNIGNRPAKPASPCVGAGKLFCHYTTAVIDQ